MVTFAQRVIVSSIILLLTLVAAAMWNHLPHMAERMRQLGIDRPQLSPDLLT